MSYWWTRSRKNSNSGRSCSKNNRGKCSWNYKRQASSYTWFVRNGCRLKIQRRIWGENQKSYQWSESCRKYTFVPWWTSYNNRCRRCRRCYRCIKYFKTVACERWNTAYRCNNSWGIQKIYRKRCCSWTPFPACKSRRTDRRRGNSDSYGSSWQIWGTS